jgi:hypothetical protein
LFDNADELDEKAQKLMNFSNRGAPEIGLPEECNNLAPSFFFSSAATAAEAAGGTGGKPRRPAVAWVWMDSAGSRGQLRGRRGFSLQNDL